MNDWLKRITCSVLVALACILPATSIGSTAGPRSAGTTADDAAVGTLTWSNTANIAASDDSKATVSGNAAAVSHYLKATNFGFTVPAGATINGIQTEWELRKNGMGNCNDSSSRIVKADGSIGSANKGTSTNLGTSDAYTSYGGAADLWSETWTATAINDSDFGAVLSITFPGASCQAECDHVRITVTYTAAATSSGPLLMGVGKPTVRKLKQTRSARLVQTAI